MVSEIQTSYMERCLALARQAAAKGEVPVGACVVLRGEIIGEGYNSPIGSCDPSAHAEICALRAAALKTGNYRLPEAWLYTSIEPCMMCVGALVHARIAGLVFGAREPKTGVVVSRASLLDNPPSGRAVAWQEGVLADAAGTLMREFFAGRRADL